MTINRGAPMSALQELELWLDHYDADLKFEAASECAWSGQLRLTLTDPDQTPSRSITFFAAGGMGPEDLAEALLVDAKAWLAESDDEPLPVPEWRGREVMAK